MEFGIFNLMGAREAEKLRRRCLPKSPSRPGLPTSSAITTAWFAEHHFSNYCLCASPLMMVAHCAAITRKIRLGTAVLVLPLYNPARLAAEIATADAMSNGRLLLGVGAGYQPYEFERFGVDLKQNLEMTEEFYRNPRPRADPGFLHLRRQALPACRKPTFRRARCRSRCRSMSPATPRRCSAPPPATATACCRRAGSAASKLLAEQYADIVAALCERKECRCRARTSR